MNCLQTRRLLLAEPQRPAPDVEAHLAACVDCSNFAATLAPLERHIDSAVRVPAPDGLAGRIIAGRRAAPRRRYAAAAAVVMMTALAALGAAGYYLDAPLSTRQVEAVGPAHPAVTAISEVAEDTVRAPISEGAASEELAHILQRLGLHLAPKANATTHYVGKCHVTAGACDHIVVTTPDAQANVMLVADYPLASRLLVADRNLVALIEPARAGGFIVVADTQRNAQRIAKLLVKS